MCKVRGNEKWHRLHQSLRVTLIAVIGYMHASYDANQQAGKEVLQSTYAAANACPDTTQPTPVHANTRDCHSNENLVLPPFASATHSPVLAVSPFKEDNEPELTADSLGIFSASE